MAAINSEIRMTTIEGRPCWVDGRRAIFHRWTDSARPVKPVSNDQDTDERLQKWSVHGLVEYEDGTVEREWPSKIRFADSPARFAEMDWDTLERRRDAMDNEENLEVELNPNCHTCANADPVLCAEYSVVNEYDCDKCPAPCICKTCEDSNKWEPKGGPHG